MGITFHFPSCLELSNILKIMSLRLMVLLALVALCTVYVMAEDSEEPSEEEEEATEEEEGGCVAHEDMYLGGYCVYGKRNKKDVNAFGSLAIALAKCKETRKCGGVTKEDRSDQTRAWTLRRSTKLKPSRSGEMSWLISEC